MKIRTPVWMFHHVEPAPLDPPALHPDSYLTPEELGAILDLLADRGYETQTLAEAGDLWRRGETPSKTVVLTFDDGCRCFREHALPELEKRGMKATLFALSGSLAGGPEATNHWDRGGGAPLEHLGDRPQGEREERLLDAEGLREIVGRGVEVGCHGARHRRLPECSDAELEAEIVRSREELTVAVGRPVQTFCYPYGHSSPRARELVESAGYRVAAGIEGHPGARLDDPLVIPRMILRPGESRFEILLKASGRYRLWKRLPRLGVLRRLSRRGEGRPVGGDGA